jgi:hypothetical protein
MFDLPHPLGRDPVSVELELGAVAKRLEAENLQLFQFEQRVLLGDANLVFYPAPICHPERSESIAMAIDRAVEGPAVPTC